MKYLVNRETKEHRICEDMALVGLARDWEVIEADSEGWIPWNGGTESPIAKKMRFEAKFRNGDIERAKGRRCYRWYHRNDRDIIAYRPILTEQSEPAPVVADVFHRLRTATEQAASIPSIIAEIDELLGPEYQVVRVEKVEATAPQEDMGDWRNWKPGDRIVCSSWEGQMFNPGQGYFIEEDGAVITETGMRATVDSFINLGRFEFHSRPTGATK